MTLTTQDSAKEKPDELRKTLGRFATGVTVVTALDDTSRPIGMTANSFTSVSLAPPMVLWNLSRDANCYDAMSAAKNFVINILAKNQSELSRRFATTATDKFEGVDWTVDASGAPVLSSCIAYLHCRQHQSIEAGDHTIILADVTAHSLASNAEPLLFVDGSYRSLD